MPVKKLSTSKEDKQNVVSTRNNIAGAVTDPSNHYGKGTTLPSGAWETPAQQETNNILSRWFGRK